MSVLKLLWTAGLVVGLLPIDHAKAQSAGKMTVTPDNFVRAESDTYFAGIVKAAGGLARFDHNRKPMAIDDQKVIRANRDTLYSAAVFDLDAGPVTITMPDAGSRFMSMIIINEDEYIPFVHYGAGSRTLTKSEVGTRYVLVGIRTFVDPNDPDDLAKVHALQDAVRIEQKQGSGNFEIPSWDPVSQKKVRDALLLLAATLPDAKGMFGSKDQTDSVRHLIGAATGWGGNPDRDAMYLTVTPEKNDGSTVYQLQVKDVPVDGFWSVTMYNASGYIEPNPYGAYSLNNVSAKKQADGSVRIQFGGCDGKVPNCLPTTSGWNYWVRLYRPREEILNGTWKFPEPQQVK
ncbi:DUF1254 domain-containing protein [Bradyrhizobium glycinis]|uniref:DUF1254 domain-containing protein n=1 Tax=Bradyrhizobium glycinis TaxID=2751812 RepID=UPI0018D8DEE9|nr:DUF1254 domain-containing protein [Bradyrhizobium glycinis]